MSATSPTLTPELYAQGGGLFCPVCESNDIRTGAFQSSFQATWQPCTCNSCQATWNDTYVLTGYAGLEYTP